MLVEIRNYHYDPSKFDAYREWAINDAVPFLKANLDVIGFFVAEGTPAEFSGSDPMELKHGSANVTWMIRWESMEKRTEGHKAIFGGEGWREIWARHPDANGYLQMEAHFATEV